MSAAIRETFAACKAEGRAVFVPYITAAYPRVEDTVPLMLALERGGADVIELGMPFSDPMADGPTIQASNTRALANGVTFAKCLDFVREARAAGLSVPVLLMGYINPLLRYGEIKAVRDAREAGVNGFIVVDLPLEEGPVFLKACRDEGMSFVPLMAPTTRDERMPTLVRAADSFIYCVSVAGVTGQRNEMNAGLPAFLDRIRKHTDLPLAVGFGISERRHFVHVEKLAEGVVIGSKVIKTITAAPEGKCAEAVERFVKMITGKIPEEKDEKQGEHAKAAPGAGDLPSSAAPAEGGESESESESAKKTNNKKAGGGGCIFQRLTYAAAGAAVGAALFCALLKARK